MDYILTEGTEENMGFFNRKKGLVDLSKAEIPDIEYESLRTELIQNLGNGSKDAKVLEITFEGDVKVNIYGSNGEIKYAYTEQLPLELDQRLFWLDSNDYDVTKISDIAKENSDFSNLDFYAAILKDVPEGKIALDKILHDYTLSVLELIENKKIVKLVVDLLFDEARNLVNNVKFINLPVRDVNNELDSMRSEIATLNSQLLSNNDLNLKLTERVSDINTSNDEQRMLSLAASAESTLAEVKDVSSGFLWVNILRELKSLIDSGEIGASYDDSDNSEYSDVVDLPVGEVKSEVPLESLELPSAAVVTDNDVLADDDEDGLLGYDSGKSSTPLLRDSNDDGDFAYESIESESPNMTARINDPAFFDYVKKVTNFDGVSETAREEVDDLTKENDEFEKRVKLIEDKIKPLINSYNEAFEIHQELSFKANFSDTEPTEKDKYELNNATKRVNEAFFNLEQAEHERYDLNMDRLDILDELKIVVSVLPGDYIQELLHQIQLKIDGVKNVVNIAFGSPEENRDINTVDDISDARIRAMLAKEEKQNSVKNLIVDDEYSELEDENDSDFLANYSFDTEESELKFEQEILNEGSGIEEGESELSKDDSSLPAFNIDDYVNVTSDEIEEHITEDSPLSETVSDEDEIISDETLGDISEPVESYSDEMMITDDAEIGIDDASDKGIPSVDVGDEGNFALNSNLVSAYDDSDDVLLLSDEDEGSVPDYANDVTEFPVDDEVVPNSEIVDPADSLVGGFEDIDVNDFTLPDGVEINERDVPLFFNLIDGAEYESLKDILFAGNNDLEE